MYLVLSKKLKFILYIIFILITLYFILNTGAAPAGAQGLSLSLEPSLIEIHALPPTVATSTLSIQNKGDTQVTLQIQLKSFKAKGENARPPATSVAGEVGRGELEYLNSQDSFVTKNVRILDGQVSVEGITMGPGQQKKLTLNVNIPQDTTVSARPPASSVAGEVGRDYYFSIILVSQSTASPTSTSSFNRLGIASNVLLSVGAKEAPDAVLEEFSSGLFYESGPVPFTIRIKNKGTHFIKPKGEILIKNMFGQSIGKLDLVRVNVLSGSIRAIPNVSNLDFAHPKAVWKEDFLLGFYTATLNIALSDEGPSFTKSIHFFAFPFQLLIVIVIALISAIIITNRVKAHMKK